MGGKQKHFIYLLIYLFWKVRAAPGNKIQETWAEKGEAPIGLEADAGTGPERRDEQVSQKETEQQWLNGAVRQM